MKIATSDIESNNWIDFLMIGFYDGVTYKVFFKLGNYINYIIKNCIGYKIYFHNGGKFDFLFLIDLLMAKYKIKFIEKVGGLISIKIETNKGVIELVDSYPLLPASLDNLIKSFNIPHKKIDIDFTKNYKPTNLKLQQHLKNDCLALYDILIKTKEEFGWLSYTIASQALRKFRIDFLNGYIWNNSEKFDNYFRTNYYRGGRVEVFKGYGKNLYYYDINSLYPFVMLKDMPIGTPVRVKRYHKNKIGYYKIQLLQKTNFICSPLIKRIKKGNYYVNGNKGDIFYLITPELNILIDEKVQFKILDGYIFNKSGKLFNDYVNHYYKIKSSTKDSIKRYFSKLMLNSLYGKFGQKLYGESLETYNGQTNFKIFDAYNDLVIVDRKRNVKFKGVYIASYITSLARAHHWHLMQKVGFENIFYCDTDSIVTSKKIKTGNKIGELKLEAKIKEAVFINPKTYGYINDKNNYTVHFKGFKNTSFTYDNLKKLQFNKVKELKIEEIKMLGFKSSHSRVNGIIKSKSDYLKLVNQTKKLIKNYDKRKIIKNRKYLFITIPFNSDELE